MLFIFDHKVYVSVRELESQAIPGMKRHLLQNLSRSLRIDMLPQHPEPGRERPINDTLDVVDVAAATRPTFFELNLVNFLIQLSGQIVGLNPILRRAVFFVPHLVLRVFQEVRVSLQYVLKILYRLPIGDQKLLPVRGQLEV